MDVIKELGLRHYSERIFVEDDVVAVDKGNRPHCPTCQYVSVAKDATQQLLRGIEHIEVSGELYILVNVKNSHGEEDGVESVHEEWSRCKKREENGDASREDTGEGFTHTSREPILSALPPQPIRIYT